MLEVGSLVRATESIACAKDVRPGDLGIVAGRTTRMSHSPYLWKVRFFHQRKPTPWFVSEEEIEHVEGR